MTFDEFCIQTQTLCTGSLINALDMAERIDEITMNSLEGEVVLSQDGYEAPQETEGEDS